MEIFIVENIELARVQMPNGDAYAIFASQHNTEWPGTDSAVTFAVTRYGNHPTVGYAALESVGFFREQDAFTFLFESDTKAYTVFSRAGEEETVIRTGWGIPKAFSVRNIHTIA